MLTGVLEPFAGAFDSAKSVNNALRSLLARFAASPSPVDPYLLWALANTQLGDPNAEVSVLVQFKCPQAEISGFMESVGVPSSYRVPFYPSYWMARQSPPASTCVQPVSTSFLGILWLMAKPDSMVRFELSRVKRTDPVKDSSTFDLDDSYRRWLTDGTTTAEKEAATQGMQASGRVATAALAKAAKPLVCVVDDRCNFASRAFAPRTFEDLWHQGGNKENLDRLKREHFGSPLRLAMRWGVDGQDNPILMGFDFSGAMYGKAIADSSLPPTGSSEAAQYRDSGYMEPTFRWSHGSAVLDLIAGQAVWGRDRHRRGAWRDRPNAPHGIKFVQLPIPTINDTSGGSLAAHALDAIRYAVDQAAPGQKVIVNLSYGTHSGGHDATSLWDEGLREMLDLFDGQCPESLRKTLHVVLPAGNSHLLRCHASKLLSSPGDTLHLRWKIQPDNPDESFLEIWLPDGVEAKFEVTPAGQIAETLDSSDGKRFFMWGNPPYAALVQPRAVPQGRHGRMALLAVGATTGRKDPVELRATWVASSTKQLDHGLRRPGRAPHGVWTVKITLLSGAGCVHAWVQRGDVAPGRGRQSRGYRGRQSYLLDVENEPQGSPIDPGFTLNGIATLSHKRLHVIGAMRESDHGISAYSGAGPNRIDPERFHGPDRVVVADESLNQPGLVVKGLLSGARMRVSGTSMAAAVYTRLLYEHLSACDTTDNMVSSRPVESTPTELVPRGSATRHDLMHRGEWVKLVPENDNGALSSTSAMQCDIPSGLGGQDPGYV